MKSENSFTLVELLIVIGILAILTAAVVIILNPAELLKQGRDSQRIQDLSSLNSALSLLTTQTPDISLGTASTVYVSIPDTSATCANLGLPSLPSGYAYNCVTAANLRNTTGTGWIPVNFQGSGVSSLPTLPIDPTNTTSTGFYYTYIPGGSFELTALLESQKHASRMANDGGSYDGVYQSGTHPNLTPFFRSTGLAAWWKFDEESGTTVADSTGNGNTGTWQGTLGAQWTTSGKIGGAGNFNGTNNRVIFTPQSQIKDLTNDFTVMGWYKKNSAADKLFYLVNGQRFCVEVYSYVPNNFKVTKLGVADIYIGNPPADTLWHHVAVVYSKINGSDVYFDGVLNSHHVNTSDMLRDRAFSSQLGLGSGYHNGLLDDIRIYARPLSAAEIQAIYSFAQ